MSIALAFVLAISFVLNGTLAVAGTLGVAWERSFSGGEESGGFHLLTARRQADGSLLAVVQEGIGATAVRFDAGGAVLSSSTLSAPYLASSAVVDPFGSVVLFTQVGSLGGQDDIIVMKYDGLTGKKIWPAAARIHGVPFQSSLSGVIGSSGNVFVTTAVFRQGVGTIDWATLCYDGRTGRVLWGPAIYGDAVPSARVGGPADLAIDPAGDVVVIGFAAASDRSLWAAIKYRGATGEKVWGPVLIGAVSTAPPATVCPGPCYSPPTAAKTAFDRKGNVFLTVSSFTAPYSQAWLTAKYDGATGAVLWGPVSQKTGTDTDYDVPSAIGVNGNGDVVVGGSVQTSPYSSGVIFVNELVKYSGASGARIWGPVFVSSSISSLAFDGNGQVFVTGTSFSGYPYRTNCITSSFDGRSGRKLWEQSLGSAESAFSYSPPRVVVGSDGNATIVVGSVVSLPGAQHTELQLVSYEGATGSVAWGPIATRTRSTGTYPLDLLVDQNGDSVLVTVSVQAGSIIKYARDGRLLWGPVRIPDAASSTGYPPRAAIDLRGDIAIAAPNGVSKYSGSTGERLWGPIPVDGLDPRATALTTGPTGDILMVAISGSGWRLLRFRGLSGEILWESSYRPAANSAEPVDIGVDHNGDVFVTGSWYRDTNGPIWVTFKYSGATGEPIWGPVIFTGLGYGNNLPKQLSLDNNEDLIVTGTGTSPGGTSGKTIKYSGKTGAVIWGPSEIVVGLIFNSAPAHVMLDSVGDVFVAGARVPDPLAPFPNSFWSVMKLRGGTGERVWGPRAFPLPTSSTTMSMTLDSKGGPVIAGSVWNGNNGEWMVVGYDSTTGDVSLGPEIYETENGEEVSQIKSAGSDLVVTGTSERAVRTVRYSGALAIATLQTDLAPTPVPCGARFSASLAASNGKPPLVWEVFNGSLPPGGELDPFSGGLSGVFSERGSFSFNVRVQDATGATAERGFTIDVVDGEPYLTIEAIPEDMCLAGQYILSVLGTYASYHWLPGGETTPEIKVCPFQPTVYSVIVGEVNGCERRGSIELQPFKIELIPREPLVPPGRKRPKPIH